MVTTERPRLKRSSTSQTLIQRLEDVARETDDVTVHTAAQALIRDPEHWDDHVVYMARLQAEAKKEMFDRLTKMVERCWDPPMYRLTKMVDPPMILLDKMPGIQLEPGGIVEAGDWPKTERTVIEKSERIYFRDFLRSFWKRLTKR